ncbi:MAG: glutamate-cysteine ligase family protein [Verrucomicrobia bacterium]|nr:glutamate-cysteine ligase family protein [Verrucomicrobiota bacterium]
MPNSTFGLFERFGVELEYMIVDAATLNVRPIADKIVHAIGMDRKNEVKHGSLRWSNELVLHVIELKTDGPSRTLTGLDNLFQEEVRFLNRMLSEYTCCLLPTAMHPWMNPLTETKLWPHGDKTVYETFNRIFDCRGHGWSNLQSTHLNLPFRDDNEFKKLHTAIRLILPILPALAASSPFAEGKRAAKLDMRLEAYRQNCARIPSITGHVIPERVSSRAQYEQEILERIYKDLAPHDPDGVLHDEWVNARGAIPRFSRNTIEIRVLDIQECPAADLAILHFITSILRALVNENLASYELQKKLMVTDLEEIFLNCITTAEDYTVRNEEYLRALGMSAEKPASVGDILWHLLAKVSTPTAEWRKTIEFILRKGCLSRRIRKQVGKETSPVKLREVYHQLADCLHKGDLFGG